jgi:hypothetical protein
MRQFLTHNFKKMKIKIFYLFALLSLGLFVLNSSSGGAGLSQRADRTGSPVGSGSCATCHSGGNFGTSVSVSLLKDGEAVTQYTPGESYTYQINIQASNNPAGFGFQTVALQASDNANAGQFGALPSNTQITELDSRDYFEHDQILDNSTIEIEWTAPAEGTGDVSFYAVANAVDGAGGTSGDSPAMLSQPLTISEAMVSGLLEVDRLNVNLRLYPNPSTDWLNVEVAGAQSGRYQMQIIDVSGRVLQEQALDIAESQFIQSIAVSDLNNGQYFLRLTDGRAVASQAFLKR